MKKMIALALVLVLALAVFSSCGKKEEETAKISFTIVNKTGEAVKDVTLRENSASKPQTWSNGKLENDQEITMTHDTVVDNGAPNLSFSYALENGNNIQTTIMTKGDKVITLKLSEEGSPEADIAEK